MQDICLFCSKPCVHLLCYTCWEFQGKICDSPESFYEFLEPFKKKARETLQEYTPFTSRTDDHYIAAFFYLYVVDEFTGDFDYPEDIDEGIVDRALEWFRQSCDERWTV